MVRVEIKPTRLYSLHKWIMDWLGNYEIIFIKRKTKNSSHVRRELIAETPSFLYQLIFFNPRGTYLFFQSRRTRWVNLTHWITYSVHLTTYESGTPQPPSFLSFPAFIFLLISTRANCWNAKFFISINFF